MHHGCDVSVVVGERLGTRVVQAGGLLHGQRIHVRAHQYHGSVTIAHHADDAGGAHFFVDLEPESVELLGHDGGRAFLMETQFRMGVEVLVQLFLPVLNVRLAHQNQLCHVGGCHAVSF